MSRAFNGSNANYLYAADATTLNVAGPEITVCCFFYPLGLGGEQCLIGKWGNQYLLECNGTVLMAATFNGGYEIATGAIALSNNAWQHGAFRRNASSLRVFKDGVPDTQVGASGGIPYHSAPLIVGMKQNAQHVFNGRVAEAALWDAALSDGEILALAKGVSPARIRVPNLRGYWPLQGVNLALDVDLGGDNAYLALAGTVPLAAHSQGSPMATFAAG